MLREWKSRREEGGTRLVSELGSTGPKFGRRLGVVSVRVPLESLRVKGDDFYSVPEGGPSHTVPISTHIHPTPPIPPEEGTIHLDGSGVSDDSGVQGVEGR